MGTLRIIGIVILLGGVAMLGFSSYIKHRVEEGKTEIAGAEKSVDQGNQLFSLNPVAKEIGKGLSGMAEKKINKGKQDVAEYEELAGWLQIGGIIAIVLGALVVIFGKKRRFSR